MNTTLQTVFLFHVKLSALILYGGLLFIVSLFLIFFFAWRLNRQNRQHKKDLAAANERMRHLTRKGLIYCCS